MWKEKDDKYSEKEKKMLYTVVILSLIAFCIYIFFAFGLPKIVSLYASGKFKADVSIGTIDLVR